MNNDGITKVRRNGHTYAYGPRGNGPGSGYLGRVDPESGDISTPRRRIPNPRRTEGSIRAMELGNVLILDSVADRLGLREDLRRLFGDDGQWILALAMARAIRPSTIEGCMHTIDRTCITDVLDLDYPEDGRIPIRTMASSDSMMSFFDTRYQRSDNTFLICKHIPIRRPSMVRSDVFSGTGTYGNEGYNALITASHTGEVLGLMVVPGTPDDVTATVDLLRELSARYGMTELLLGHEFTDAGRMPRFLGTGMDLVTVTSTVISPVVPLIDRLFSEKRIILPNGDEGAYVEGRLGIIGSDRRSTYVPEQDGRYHSCDHHIRVFPTVDLRENRMKGRDLMRKLSEIKKNLDGTADDDPGRPLYGTAREFVHYLKIGETADGTRKASIDRDRVDRDRRMLGLSVIITSSKDWEEAVYMLLSTRGIRSDFRAEPSDVYGHFLIPDEEYAFDLLVTTITAMLLSNIRHTLRSNGYGIEPCEALYLASKYMLVDTGDGELLTDPDRTALRIMALFGLDG